MITNYDIEKAAAMALLDRGIAFRIPAPWLWRIFGRRTLKINVRRLYLGTLVHLSTIEGIAPLEPVDVPDDRAKVIAAMGATPRSLPVAEIVRQIKPVTQAVAACLLNSRAKIAALQWALALHLRRVCSPDQLQELVMWLFIYGRVESFTNTTELLSRMRMTMLMNSGQE